MNHSRFERLAFVGPFKFPDHSATTRRILGIGLSLNQIGYQVLIGSGQFKSMSNIYQDANPLQFITYSLNELPPNEASRLNKLIRSFTMGRNTLHWLTLLSPPPSVVFMFGGYLPYSRLILPWCKQNGIPLVIDVVEWFQPSHLPGGWGGPFHLNIEIALRYYYVWAGNIIAISSYLDDFYKGKGCHTLRVPPTLDVLGTPARLSSLGKPLTLTYAGFPGKKDLLVNVIEAVLRLDPNGKRIRLIIAGPNPDSILHLHPLRKRNLSKLPDCIEAYGLIPHDRVLELIMHSDYVPLLRPPLRYAQAGFPTKVPESLAMGTPVICNLTSDLGNYIHDGCEGIISRDYSAEACAEALECALTLTPENRVEMRKAARAQAERSFDYRVYAEPLAAFMNEVRLCT